MDWNGNRVSIYNNISRPAPAVPDNSFSCLYSYNYHHDQFLAAPSGLEMKQPLMHEMLMDKNINPKKRLSDEQLESLENSFQEEIKLDPDRKMKLAKELGLQPRQIAVWFQNRKARWKGKQLERLYDSLKQDFNNVSREKHKLQQEVLALRAVLKDQLTKQQVSTGYTEVSGEETIESTSIPCLDGLNGTNNTVHQIADCNYGLNIDSYNSGMMPTAYWATLP